MKATVREIGRVAALMLAVSYAERAMAQAEKMKLVSAAAPTVSRRLVVNIPAMELDVFENGALKRSFRVAVGKRTTQTPVGTFRVARMVKNPVWNGPRGQMAEPGPRNPVGTRWIGLDEKGYGIHGTNAPKSIGHAASHGCVRMKNEDVEELYAMVSVGDPVEIVYPSEMPGGGEFVDVYHRLNTGTGVAAAATVALAGTGDTTGGN